MKLSHILGAGMALLIAACGDPATTLSGPLAAPKGPSRAITATAAEVVMSGLNNPRGLAFGPAGALYVAEAGSGGPGPCYIIVASQVCYGPTGAVSRFWHGEQERVVTGLPSATNKAGRAEGPNSIALRGLGDAYVAVGLESNPNFRTAGTALTGFAQIVHISASALSQGKGGPKSGVEWEFVEDMGAHEAAANPDCGEIDSNPFNLLSDAGGLLIIDTGANTILRRDATGALSVFASFASSRTVPLPGRDDCPLPAGYPAVQPDDFVPTSIVRGPDGAYYIGQLTGFPIVNGAANVYRMTEGGAPELFRSGFTFIVSIAFDDAGNLYVLQNTDGTVRNPNGTLRQLPGSLIRVAPDGSRTTLLTDLTSPTSVVVGPDGGIYVSNFGARVALGQVLRIDP